MASQEPDRVQMTVPEILKELELHTGPFPKRAMQQAVEQQEAIAPELVRVLDEVAADPAAFGKREEYMLHLFAMYLLAQFRDRRAYRPLVRIFSAPGEIPEQLAGDTVTEGLAQILGSVYDGDQGPLRRLIEDASVYEYVRGAAIDTFVVLWSSGQIGREEVVDYYRSLFHEKLARDSSHAWNALVSAVVDLHAPELLEEVRQAFADQMVDPLCARLEDTEADLLAPAPPLQRGIPSTRCTLITDAISEMEDWHCFHLESSSAKKPAFSVPPPAAFPPATLAAAPAKATAPVRRVKVGRNAPCPCGSGRKYKKCCGFN